MYKKITSLQELKRGDIVRHTTGGDSYVINSGYGDNMIAVITFNICNVSEWDFNDFSELSIGSTVRHEDDMNQIIITNVYKERAIGVMVVELSNPNEWLVYNSNNE